MIIGDRIRKLRLSKGLTQKQLGEKCGMADSAIRRYESGRGNPTERTLSRIAEALQVPVYELMGYSLKHDTPENRAIADAGLRAAFGNGGAANVPEWEEVPVEQVCADQQTYLDSRMKKAFSALNETGQTVACERVEELAEMPKYKLTEPPETLSGDSEGSCTSQREKPSERPSSPSGGK